MAHPISTETRIAKGLLAQALRHPLGLRIQCTNPSLLLDRLRRHNTLQGANCTFRWREPWLYILSPTGPADGDPSDEAA